MNGVFAIKIKWIRFIVALALLCSMFSFSAEAQTDAGKPLDAKSLAVLVAELKEVVSSAEPDKKNAALVAKKWDARKDLAGKTKTEVINLLYADVKSVIKDSGILYQIYSFFSTYKRMPDESFSSARKESPTNAKSFLEMTEEEKSDFVTEKIDEISVKISGKKYPFDDEFKALVKKQLDSYTKRVGSNVKNKSFGDDLKFVAERGAEYAPIINMTFDKNGVSRLSGLYIAMIESEFNDELVAPTGSSGVFMLTSAQAKRFGMGKKDIAITSKSAEIAARLIVENQKKFASNDMKEFLAILSHNRDSKKIEYDVNRIIMDDFRGCSICGMTKIASKLDGQFQMEGVKYVPRFLAAAIIGENPSYFGLNTKPLSTIEGGD